MKVKVSEPLGSYLTESSIQSAVNLLLKNSADKRVGLDENAPYGDQAEYRAAWLAAREIYVEWHALLSTIWERVWTENPNWADANLRQLSTLELKGSDWDLPTLHEAWNEEWFGKVYRTSGGKTVQLHVIADLKRVHLNFFAPEIQTAPDGWEPDDGDFDSAEVAKWHSLEIDLSILQGAASNLLISLRGE